MAWVLFLLAISSFQACAIDVTPPSGGVSSHQNQVQDNFAGVSIEFNVVNKIIGESPGTINRPFINYMSALQSRMSHPLRLRIGGNSLDGSIYDPKQTTMIEFNLVTTNDPAEIPNEPVTYGPLLLDTLQQINRNFSVSMLLGLSMQYPSNDSDVVGFASTAQKQLGNSLDALLLGNEPDIYRQNGKRPDNYSVPNYIQDFGKVVHDLQHSPQGNLVKKAILGGPSICCSWPLQAVINGGYLRQFKKDLKYVALQHYPQANCHPGDFEKYDILYFVNHTNVLRLAKWNTAGVMSAKAAGKQVILNEYNSVSCGGQAGRSDTFAAALWSIDYSLALTINNYTAAYIHTREAGIRYNIFNPPNATGGAWSTGPQYYSLLFLAEALRPGSGSGSVPVLDLQLPQNSTAAGYAIYNSKRSKATKLVLFNYGLTGSMDFTVPKGMSTSDSIRMRVLAAPNITTSGDITWAGQAVDGQGQLQGTIQTSEISCKSGCTLSVPGPGAALIFLSNSAVGAIRGLSLVSLSVVVLTVFATLY